MATAGRMECDTLITLRKFNSKLAILRSQDVYNRHSRFFDKLELCAYTSNKGYNLAPLYEALIRKSNEPDFQEVFHKYLANQAEKKTIERFEREYQARCLARGY